MSYVRLALVTVAVIVVTTIWLVAHNRLWETPAKPRSSRRLVLYNASSITTVTTSIIIMYAVLFGLLLAGSALVVPAGFLSQQLGHDVGNLVYVDLAWLSASMGMAAGALGSSFDSARHHRRGTVQSTRSRPTPTRRRATAGARWQLVGRITAESTHYSAARCGTKPYDATVTSHRLTAATVILRTRRRTNGWPISYAIKPQDWQTMRVEAGNGSCKAGRSGVTMVQHADDDLCVARVPLFQGLTTDEQRELAAMARPTDLVTGQELNAGASSASQLVVLHTGRLKLYRVSADGHEHIIRVLEPGDFVGETAFVTGRRPEYFLSAMEPGSMCVFRNTDLRGLIGQHPSIGWRMLQTVTLRLQETESRLAALISGDVSSRLASYLLSLPSAVDDDGLFVQLPLAKKDIASLLDTTPESLSRQLRRLQDSGVVVSDGARRLVIHDVDALIELSAQ